MKGVLQRLYHEGVYCEGCITKVYCEGCIKGFIMKGVL